MKIGMKALSLILVLALVFSLSMAVSAVSMTAEADFSQSYGTHLYDEAVYVAYTPGTTILGALFTNVTGSTAVNVTNDSTGYASVTVTALNGEKKTSYATTVSSYWIDSGIAGVSGQQYAKEMFHYCDRTVNGTTATWRITYT